MKRRHLDLYETNALAVRRLLECSSVSGRIVEPCCGPGAIVKALKAEPKFLADIITNDINPEHEADTHEDAKDLKIPGEVCIITNPPFNQAYGIVKNFVEQGHRCAFMLRLSWLEPTLERGDWLTNNPPSGMIVLPRHSYTRNGKTDLVTTAWMLWNWEIEPKIQISKPKPKKARNKKK